MTPSNPLARTRVFLLQHADQTLGTDDHDVQVDHDGATDCDARPLGGC